MDRKDYFFIPKYAMADSVSGIFYQDKAFSKTDHRRRRLNIYWISSCEDGYYNLSITPKQIFFFSTHENPNPNQLFWVIDIDSIQYKNIIYGFKHKRPFGFEDASYKKVLYQLIDKGFKDDFVIPNNWDEQSLKQHDFFCVLQRRKQLTKYFFVINSFITASEKISFPNIDSLEKIKPKYFYYSKEELQDIIDFDKSGK